MNNKQRILIFIAILLQVLLLLSIVAEEEMSIRQGVKIVVMTIPVDPRSLFSGDYINLNYAFSLIDLNKTEHGDTHFSKGQKVFVRLLKVGKDWQATQVSLNSIKDAGPDEIIIKGSINQWPRDSINVVYGIESYFVPEGKGKCIEDEMFAKRVTVELSIDKQGSASVCKIFIDGKEVKFR
ncbi:MAG: GDYXXLXY domain-containing protein [Nitrospirota bacterium]